MTQARETEEFRQQLVAELEDEHGPDWTTVNTPGTFGCHELLDRTLLVSHMLENFVLKHPACIQNPEWFALARLASDAVNDLYQRISAEHLDAE